MFMFPYTLLGIREFIIMYKCIITLICELNIVIFEEITSNKNRTLNYLCCIIIIQCYLRVFQINSQLQDITH